MHSEHEHSHECSHTHTHAHAHDAESCHSHEHGPEQKRHVPGTKRTVFGIVDLDCPDCAKKIRRAASSVEGVLCADLLFASRKLVVEHTGDPSAIISAVARVGEKLEILDNTSPSGQQPFWQSTRFRLTALSGVMLIAAVVSEFLLGADLLTVRALYALAVVSGGALTAISGVKAATSGFSFDMNFLMTLAVTGAIIIGEWMEAATVVFLFSLGNALESYTLDRTTRSIRDLINLTPPTAEVRREGVESSVAVDELLVGDVILISPGARIPADAVVLSGESAVNQAPITGESVPEWKVEGKEVFAGSINGTGYLEARVTRSAQHSTISKIVELVEEAQSKKSPVERVVDKFARHYTPVVIVLAACIALLPPLFGEPFAPWFYRALALLVVSCPCALVISTPVSIAAAVSNAARSGVLVKGGAYIEQMASLDSIAFDKTGTLTHGKPSVTDVIGLGMEEREVLRLAAVVEHRSEHPFGRAIVEHALALAIEYDVEGTFYAIAGKGARLTSENHDLYVATPEALEQMGVDLDGIRSHIEELRSDAKSVSVLSESGRVLGILAVADTLRDEASQTIADLRKAGIKHVALLTGDNELTASALARKVGITEVHAALLPEHKVDVVRHMASQGKVAMVGDGMNDAPALAAADIGIAMGAAGTDVALETADIALMGDDLTKIPLALGLSRRAMRIIRQNIVFALLVKAVAVLLVFPGLLTLWLAIAADTGAALIVILNGMRLLRTHHSDRSSHTTSSA